MDNTEHIIQELKSEKWEMAQEIERLREQERKMTNHALERMEEIERLRESLKKIDLATSVYALKNIPEVVSQLARSALQQKAENL